jgi:AraC-like DNA-binding protein
MSVGSTLVRGAEVRFQEAAEKLRPFVGCFWVITADREAVLQLTVVGIRLRPGVAFILTGVAMETLVDRRIDLTSIAPFRDLVAVEPRPRTPAEYIASLEHFLIQRLEHAAIHPVVASVLAELDRRRGALRASELAAQSGISARHLNRLMHRWVGFGPKRLASRRRSMRWSSRPNARWRHWRWRTVISTSLT